MSNHTTDYIDCNEIVARTGVSIAKGYAIIRKLNAQHIQMNHDALIIRGKVNRDFYEHATAVQSMPSDLVTQ